MTGKPRTTAKSPAPQYLIALDWTDRTESNPKAHLLVQPELAEDQRFDHEWCWLVKESVGPEHRFQEYGEYDLNTESLPEVISNLMEQGYMVLDAGYKPKNNMPFVASSIYGMPSTVSGFRTVCLLSGDLEEETGIIALPFVPDYWEVPEEKIIRLREGYGESGITYIGNDHLKLARMGDGLASRIAKEYAAKVSGMTLPVMGCSVRQAVEDNDVPDISEMIAADRNGKFAEAMRFAVEASGGSDVDTRIYGISKGNIPDKLTVFSMAGGHPSTCFINLSGDQKAVLAGLLTEIVAAELVINEYTVLWEDFDARLLESGYVPPRRTPKKMTPAQARKFAIAALEAARDATGVTERLRAYNLGVDVIDILGE